MKTKIASVVAALAFIFVAGASAQDPAGKTDWREMSILGLLVLLAVLFRQ